MSASTPPDFIEAIARIDDASPFLSRLLALEPAITASPQDWVADPLTSARIDDPTMAVAKRLRVERRRIALAIAIGDISGAIDLNGAMLALSDFADYALDTAIRTAIEERTPGAEPKGFVAIALGKQGSRELNYSSDIDPILLFDPNTLPCRAGEAPEKAAVRIGRRVVELLQARDGDGYVLRVDLRLRPSPEATPIAIPIDAAISYYESQALPWERAAFIRARSAAGDIVLGERFLEAIRPFVWRRALDFGTIAEIRLMTRRIRDHHAKGQQLGPGYDLKRGRGGIREAEFFAQIHQLIHGGRDPALRLPATQAALAALADAGWIGQYEAESLAAGYAQLRVIEHRFQMIDDRQTHMIPQEAEAIDRVCRLQGLPDLNALIAVIAPHVRRIGEIYDALDADGGEALPVDGERVTLALDEAGICRARPGVAAGRGVAVWRLSRAA